MLMRAPADVVLQSRYRNAASADHAESPLRVGLLADYLEEGWLSMDYVAEMTYRAMSQDDSFSVSLLRPVMRKALSRLPGLRGSAPAFNADRLRSRLWDYPAWLRPQTGDYELFHIIDHSYAHLALTVPQGRAVVSCYDIDAFRCLAAADAEPRPWWFRAFSARILKGLRSAAHVICGSRSVQAELSEAGLLGTDNTTVIYPGVHPSCSAVPDADADGEAGAILGPSGDFADLLHVGSTIPRKGIENLLKIFAAVRCRNPRVRLVRVGGRFTDNQNRLIDDLGLRGAVCQLAYLERPVLAAVYRRAALVLQPSIAEGFGLPVVEAMACGTRVVASDIPVFHETGGAAVDYCGAADREHWSETILRLLDQREKSSPGWMKLREEALLRASMFTWKSHAEKLASLYRELSTAAPGRVAGS